MFDSVEERKERKKEQRAIDISTIFNEIAESPEKLTMELALEVYNDYPHRRNQIYQIYFKFIKEVDIWLSIYRESKENHTSRELAKSKIKKSQAPNKVWIDLFETEKDEFIKRVAIVKLKESSKTLEEWIAVYHDSSYGFETNNMALAKMREFSKTYEDWKKVYEIAPFGSVTQGVALQNVLVTAREKTQKDIQERQMKSKAIKKERDDFVNDYENERDLYSVRKDYALINMYLTAK